MSIKPFLNGQAFDPEDLETMSAAFTDACHALGLVDRTDLLTELVAARIIAFASRGVSTKTALYLSVMQEFKSDQKQSA